MPPVGEKCASGASAGVRSCPGLTCNAPRKARLRLTIAFRIDTLLARTIAKATTESPDPAAAASFLCHGSDSRADPPVAVTAGDHRTVCSPQPAAADRRPRIRGVAPPRTGVAACRRGFGNVDRKRPDYFRERGEVRRGGISGLQLRREGRGRRRATRARRFGVLRCLDVAPVTSTELRQRRTRGPACDFPSGLESSFRPEARTTQPLTLVARGRRRQAQK